MYVCMDERDMSRSAAMAMNTCRHQHMSCHGLRLTDWLHTRAPPPWRLGRCGVGVASWCQVSSIVDDFRRKHLAELQLLSASSGTSLGYGFHSAGTPGGAVGKAAAKEGAAAGSGSDGAGGPSSLTPSAA